MAAKRGKPMMYDAGYRHRYRDGMDPTFWEVFNERTDPLPDVEDESSPGDGYVYFLHCPAIRRVKIGRSVSPQSRRKAVRRDVGGLPLVMLGCLRGGSKLETLMHRRFAERRISGEWFSDDIIEEAETLIRADREFFSLV